MSMKQIRRLLVSLIGAIILASPSADAQIYEAAKDVAKGLFNIAEGNDPDAQSVHDRQAEKSRARQFGEDMRKTIEQITYMQDQLEAARTMVDGFQKAYSVYDALFVGGDQLRQSYNELTGLINDAEAFNRSLNDFGQKGGLSFREVNNLLYDMERIIKAAISSYQSIERITDKDVKLDIRSRLDLLNKVIDDIKNSRQVMDSQLEEAMKEAEYTMAVTTAEQLIDGLYIDNENIDVYGGKLHVPTADEILKKMESRKEGVNTIKKAEKAAEDKAEENIFANVSGFGQFILLVIGLLSVIFAIPTFLKVVNGEHQSKNALFKWIAGTIAMVGIVLLFDLYLF